MSSSNSSAVPPDNPAGEFELHRDFDSGVQRILIALIADAPGQLRAATTGLDDNQLDTNYKNWTIRQITHHLADSHLHSMIRFKWALTEENPLIKAYEEADWVRLDDCAAGAVGPAIAMLEGLHTKWVQVLESMTAEQYARTFRHPQSGETVSLWEALNYYAWHGRHHTAQIRWLRQTNDWNSVGGGD